MNFDKFYDALCEETSKSPNDAIGLSVKYYCHLAFQAGAASRDAEIQRLQFALADSEALELGTAEHCDQLRAHINELINALSACAYDEDGYCINPDAAESLAATPEQSLTEYRNKVIEDVERYRWLRGYMASERTDLDEEIVEACSTDKPEKLDAFIDTAIRAMNEQP